MELLRHQQENHHPTKVNPCPPEQKLKLSIAKKGTPWNKGLKGIKSLQDNQ